MKDWPQIAEEGAMLAIVMSASPAHRQEDVDCDLDVTDFGEAIGIEILFFRERLNAAPPPRPGSGRPNWFYDSEADVFYIRVQEGRATRQKKAVAQASIDKSGNLVALRIPTAAP